MTILGELPLSEGTITVKGKIAYASQQAWVYNGSLRQNILFGHGYDQDKFTEVIKACALDKVPNIEFINRIQFRFIQTVFDSKRTDGRESCYASLQPHSRQQRQQ